MVQNFDEVCVQLCVVGDGDGPSSERLLKLD